MRLLGSFLFFPIFLSLSCVAVAADIPGAFLKDGWNVTSSGTGPAGGVGFHAISTTATTLDTGKAKKALYVSGSAHDMGYLVGLLSTQDVEKMAVVYVSQLPVELVAQSLFDKAQKSKRWRKVYDAVVYLIGDLLVAGANGSFQRLLGAGGYFPQALVDEMKGIVDGCAAANPSTGVTFDRIVTLNYGIDFLLAHAYSGKLGALVASRIDHGVRSGAFAETTASDLRAYIAEGKGPIVKDPMYCDAFGLTGAAVKPGSGTIFARDFQMPTGTVLQDTSTVIVYAPSDGRRTLMAASAPGFVGGVTVVNDAGVAVGVDVLRAAAVDPSAPGFNSLLLIRHAADHASTVSEAVSIIAGAKRGVAWLYPMCDRSGDCRIVEAGRSDDSPTFAPLQFVSSPEVLAALPNATFLEENPAGTPYLSGVYARRNNYTYPAQYLGFNERLFAVAKYPYNATNVDGGPGNFVFPTFEANNEAAPVLTANWFDPQRETWPDTVVCSNSAVVPHMRIAEMGAFSDFIERTAHAIQYRYDALVALLAASRGEIDLDKAQWLISFLSPERTPGYWPPTRPNDPMSALVEGSITVCDLGPATECRVLSGFWADKWVKITLANYL